VGIEKNKTKHPFNFMLMGNINYIFKLIKYKRNSLMGNQAACTNNNLESEY